MSKIKRKATILKFAAPAKRDPVVAAHLAMQAAGDRDDATYNAARDLFECSQPKSIVGATYQLADLRGVVEAAIDGDTMPVSALKMINGLSAFLASLSLRSAAA